MVLKTEGPVSLAILAPAILAQGLVQQGGYETPHAMAFTVKLLLLAAVLVVPSAFVASRDILVLVLHGGRRRHCEVRGQVVAPRRSPGSFLRLRRLVRCLGAVALHWAVMRLMLLAALLVAPSVFVALRAALLLIVFSALHVFRPCSSMALCSSTSEAPPQAPQVWGLKHVQNVH